MGEIRYRVVKPRDLGKVYASCLVLWDQILVSHRLYPGLQWPAMTTVVVLTLTLLQYLVKRKLCSFLKRCAYI